MNLQNGKYQKHINPVDYLTFSSENPFTLSVCNATKNWDGTLYYSADAISWYEWSGAYTLSSDYHNGEYRLYMCGVGNTRITGNSTNYGWVLSGMDIRCSGNIETLLDYQMATVGEHPVMASYCYQSMFYNCTSLISVPELPATTLVSSCYSYMFQNCTSLTTPPELPATNLAISCYSDMFRNCTSLTAAPELPATTLAKYCYASMFSGCTSLTTLPELPATTLASNCYRYMFSGCTSLTSPPELPATTLDSACYAYMFNGCISLTTLPELPATTLVHYCYYYMFNGCTNIKLSTTKTEEYNIEYRIPCVGDGATVTLSLTDMFTNTGGTFTGTPSINTTYYLYNTN